VGGIDEGAGAGGANVGDNEDDGADLARVGAAEEQRHPHRGRVRSGGGGCC
jgi:hypothetical protein